ncbi:MULTISPECIES: hypothetical protein [unclassified Anabaena]|uniref:hypothetical protein n=1 Tax=Anabaena sp. UHCC 0253 TaxID=2590019 RepID=UPI00157FEAED|nr:MULTISPECIES: hypothetical protein [unclassified Anabaena]
MTLVVIIGVVKFWNKLPDYPCENGGFMVSQTTQSYLHPEKVVVRPWLGQHHVYAVFMLPNNYVYDRLITINLPVNKKFCGITINPSQTIDEINAKPGHYLVKGYLQTRTALRLISTGKINDLKQIKSWQLGYGKKN